MDACLRCQAESKVDAKSLGAGASKDCVVSRKKGIFVLSYLLLLIPLRWNTEIINALNGIFCRLFGENAIIHSTTAV